MVRNPGRRFNTPAALRLTLIYLLAVGCWLSGDRPAVLGGPDDPRVAPPAAGQAQPSVLTNPDYFTNLKKRADEQKQKADENLKKVREVAQQHIDAQAKARGQEQARRQPGLTLDEINARLNAPPGPPLPPGTPGYRIEPGMRVDVIMKDGANEYSGALVGFDGAKVLVQTIPIAGVKPSEFDLDRIQAFQTSFGVFAYSPTSRRIVPALTYYSFNKATGDFDRMQTGNGDAFLADDAKVVGPTNSAWALFGTAPDGAWAIGLPVPLTESPQAIPGYHFQQIITSQGTYTYDANTKNFTYKTHAQFAQEAKAAQDAAGQAYYKQEWDRKTKEYELGTSRAQALAPYYNSTRWVWWRR